MSLADQAIGLAQVVVAVAEEALRQARAHFFGLGADRAVREILTGAEDLWQCAVQQIRRGW